MKTATFRYSNSTVTSPTETGVWEVFPNSSGVLKFKNSAGSELVVGQVFPTVLSGNVAGQLGTFVTGLQPSITGSLGTTTTFFVVNGPSGGNQYAIPAYRLL